MLAGKAGVLDPGFGMGVEQFEGESHHVGVVLLFRDLEELGKFGFL